MIYKKPIFNYLLRKKINEKTKEKKGQEKERARKDDNKI